MTDEAKTEEKETPQQPAPPLVQDIINNYPIDRDRVRDTLLLNLSNGVNRIANALEYFVNQDAADRKANQIMKDRKEESRVD